jgi:hypothetical protein
VGDVEGAMAKKEEKRRRGYSDQSGCEKKKIIVRHSFPSRSSFFSKSYPHLSTHHHYHTTRSTAQPSHAGNFFFVGLFFILFFSQ